MAILNRSLNCSFEQAVRRVENAVMNGSVSASLEETWDARDGDARCSVRVFERYSYMGGNRVSMSVTLFQNGNGPVKLCAITSGGSQAMFFKVNTFGEEAFLQTLADAL